MTPRDRLSRTYGGAHAALIIQARKPNMDADVAYALFPTVTAVPIAKPSLQALARHIHGERRSQAIELVDGDPLQLQDGAELRVVSIYVTEFGSRTHLIGHAWLDGQGRAALSAELRRQRPDRTQHLVAA